MITVSSRSKQLSLLKPLVASSLLLRPPIKEYSQKRAEKKEEEEEESSAIGEKARSTAEEFERQAKEKAKPVAQGVKEGSEAPKTLFKETVEKGHYDMIGKDE